MKFWYFKEQLLCITLLFLLVKFWSLFWENSFSRNTYLLVGMLYWLTCSAIPSTTKFDVFRREKFECKAWAVRVISIFCYVALLLVLLSTRVLRKWCHQHQRREGNPRLLHVIHNSRGYSVWFVYMNNKGLIGLCTFSASPSWISIL